jgi:hypothetical protein
MRDGMMAKEAMMMMECALWKRQKVAKSGEMWSVGSKYSTRFLFCQMPWDFVFYAFVLAHVVTFYSKQRDWT